MGMSIGILVIIIFMAMVGKGKGVVNYKFTIEKIVLTFLFLPLLANFAKGHLIALIPEMIASIVAVVLSLIIVFLIIGFILGKLAKIPEYEATSGDKFMGFVAGAIKGYVLMALLIMIYGIAFADIVAPGMVTQQMKYNFVNNKIENSIEYYRTTVYSLYRSAKSSDVTSLTSKSDDYYKGKTDVDIKGGAKEKNSLKGRIITDTSVAGYIPWVRGSTVLPIESEPEKEKVTKK
ncbi:MAG: CvpA family protein [Candidatus Delongbacteria bacterium]|nr:CvpA family protein [Candidatus Delongbacteria bacterium]